MSTQPLGRSLPALSQTNLWTKCQSSLESVAQTQCRPGTFYSRLRPYVPVTALVLAWYLLSQHLIGGANAMNQSITVRHLVLGSLMIMAWNLCFAGTHPRGLSNTLKAELIALTMAVLSCGSILAAAHVLLRPEASEGLGLNFMVCLICSYLFLIIGTWLLGEHLLPRIAQPRMALVVGTGPLARGLRKTIEAEGGQYEVIGCIDDEYCGVDPESDNYKGKLSELEVLLKTQPIKSVLIGLPLKSMYGSIQRVIETCEAVGVDACYPSNMFKTRLASAQRPKHAHQSHLTMLGTQRHDYRMYYKRAIDVVCSSLMLLAAFPLMLAVTIAIRITSPGPIFFAQERYGLNRQRFRMFKFRTMVVDAEARQAALESANEAQGPVFKIKKDPRITRIGSFLRRTSIDELPQLINVLRGDMSLVGPRPLPLRDVGRFEETWLLRRFSVKPGLTCLWQINGRSNTDFADWIRQDLKYIDHWSLSLDIKILLKTVPVVLKGSGAV